eukprot:COSAG02_NODE_1230_length_13767_cov_16.238294_7_plen_48_part_00
MHAQRRSRARRDAAGCMLTRRAVRRGCDALWISVAWRSSSSKIAELD